MENQWNEIQCSYSYRDDEKYPLSPGGYPESIAILPSHKYFYLQNTPSVEYWEKHAESGGSREVLDLEAAEPLRLVEHGNYEIITAGCSWTYGSCVPRQYAWPNLISANTGKQVLNFGMNGASISYSASHLIFVLSNINRQSFPLQIYGFFPEIVRHFGPLQRDGRRSEFAPSNIPFHGGEYKLCVGDRDYVPYKIVDIYGNIYKQPTELSVWQNFLLLDALIALCKVADIDFTFSSWQYADQEIFNNLQYQAYKPPLMGHRVIVSTGSHAGKTYKWIRKYHPHGPRPFEQFGLKDAVVCEHEPQSDEQEKLWDIAADFGHPGIHDHIHFAEFFSNVEINNSMLKKL